MLRVAILIEHLIVVPTFLLAVQFVGVRFFSKTCLKRYPYVLWCRLNIVTLINKTIVC